MSVRIQRLSIRNFGPLRNLVLLPGPVTVVYGQNEAAKHRASMLWCVRYENACGPGVNA